MENCAHGPPGQTRAGSRFPLVQNIRKRTRSHKGGAMACQASGLCDRGVDPCGRLAGAAGILADRRRVARQIAVLNCRIVARPNKLVELLILGRAE